MKPRAVSRFKIAHKLALSVAAMLLLTMGTLWLVNSYTSASLLRQQADALGNTLAAQTAILVTELVLANDLISMNVLLNQLTRDAAVSQAAVLNVDDRVIAISGSSGSLLSGAAGSYTFGSYVAPVALQDSLAGYVRIHLDQRYLDQGRRTQLLMMAAAMSLLFVLTLSLILTLFRQLVGLPLYNLAYYLRELRYGRPEYCPFEERGDEMAAAIRQYNRLVETLRGPEPEPEPEPAPDPEAEIPEQEVGRQRRESNESAAAAGEARHRAAEAEDTGEAEGWDEPPDASEDEHPAAELWAGAVEVYADDAFLADDRPTPSIPATEHAPSLLTVMCIRLDNFSELRKKLPPRQMAAIWHNCNKTMKKLAGLYRGTLETRAADEFVLSFDSRGAEREQIFHACCSALLFTRAVRQLNQALSRQGLPELDTAAALHSAEPDIEELITGAYERDLHVTELLHIARQICRQSPRNGLLVSRQSLIQGDCRDRFVYQEHGQLVSQLNGERLQAFLITSAREDTRPVLERQARVLFSAEKELS